MKRKIAVFTGTRAEYGLMRRMLKILNQNPDIDLQLMVSGSHLQPAYGYTVKEILQDKLPVHYLDIEPGGESGADICSSMGRGMKLYGEFFHRASPDILVALGDRYECFCAVACAALNRIPVAHLYGGEITQGAIDDVLRHAMTKMSHLHFTSCGHYTKRILQMGENPKNIWTVGSLGVENALSLPSVEREAVCRWLDIPQDGQYILATWHPATLENADPLVQIKILLAALREIPDIFYIFTGANADAGGNAINNYLQSETNSDSRMRFFMSLGLERYINTARHSLAVVGNSSSGVNEIPSLGIPVLNIGSRQKGRDCSKAVIHCAANTVEVKRGLNCVLSPQCKTMAENTLNPLQKDNPSKTIADIIAQIPLEGILQKEFFEIELV